MTLRGLFIALVMALATFAANANVNDGIAYDDALENHDGSLSRFVHIDALDYDLYQVLPSKSSDMANSDKPVFSVCPSFVTEIFTGVHSVGGYKIELRYPEFQELTSKEKKNIGRYLSSMGFSCIETAMSTAFSDSVQVFPSPVPVLGLNLQHYVSISQKKDYVNVSFSPIVYHDNAWKRITSCQIKVTPVGSFPHHAKIKESADRWTSNSVLSEGKWCKIRVEDEGVYQLNGEAIKKMGFSDLAKVKIYGYGGLLQDEEFTFPDYNPNILQNTSPDDLIEVPVLETTDGRILFWMEGTRRLVSDVINKRITHKQNHYSRYSYYFVTENDAPRLTASMLQDEGITPSKTIETVPYVSVLDPDYYNWYTGGRKMFDSFDFQNNNVHSYRLYTPDCVTDDNNISSVTISIGAASSISPTNFNMTINGTKLGSLSIETLKNDTYSAVISTKQFTVPVTLSTDGNVIQLTQSGSNSARLDYIRINYNRHLTASSAPYSFSIPESSPVSLQVANATAGVHLWRLGQNGMPHEEVAAVVKEGALFANISTPKRRFVFFDEGNTFPVPEYVGDVENQNLHAHNDVDYVIIVPASGKLVEQAERLGRLHAKLDGIRYSVVRADQLYNEFSSGTPDANAYRRYLKMLYDRASSSSVAMPRYCLLMGKSSWDNRFLSEYWSQRAKNIDDYLLAYEVDNTLESVGSVNSYVSDDFFGFLDDGEGINLTRDKLDVAMGRMVCVTAEDATLLVDKVEKYVQNKETGSWKNTIAMLADDGDDNSHIADAEAVAASIERVAPDLNLSKIYWDRYKWTAAATGYTYPQGTANIIKQMKDGALIFNYSGHGSPHLISHQKVLQTNDFRQAYSPYMPLWVLASCEIYPFDHEDTNLAEASLYVRDGGSIGFVCATRSVYASYNNAFNRSYCIHALSKDKQGHLNTMGEALRLAKNEVVTSKADLTINKLKFVLFGDPALRLALPTGTVVLDSINGRNIADNAQLINLPAGSVVEFSGHVCAENSEACDTSFDGEVTATIYDAAEAITCKNNQKSDKGPYVFSERQRVVYKGSTKAVSGKFKFKIVIPMDITYSPTSGRISFYAVSNDKVHEYKGMSEAFTMNGTAIGEIDTEAPKVIAFINSIDNPDYSVTGSSPILIANISDESGINTSGLSMGHDIELIIDGNTAESTSLNEYFTYDFDSYQTGQIVYQLQPLAYGPHTATLRVWDISNNMTTTDVHFIVSDREAQIGKNGYVTATRNPAFSETRLIAYHPTGEESCDRTTFEIFDHSGSLVTRMDAPEVCRGSSFLNWNLRAANGQILNAGVYFYRAVFHTAIGKKVSASQKLIILQ